MKYVFLALLFVFAIAAPDAEACQQCKIDMYGCLQCRELPYDGYQGCIIFANGLACAGVNGACQGPAGPEEDCGDTPQACVLEQWGSLPEKRDIQLAHVVILREKSGTSASAGS